jgi:hypothetical protein
MPDVGKSKAPKRLMKESDWKRFIKIKELAPERFCADAMADFEEAIQNERVIQSRKILVSLQVGGECRQAIESVI